MKFQDDLTDSQKAELLWKKARHCLLYYRILLLFFGCAATAGIFLLPGAVIPLVGFFLGAAVCVRWAQYEEYKRIYVAARESFQVLHDYEALRLQKVRRTATANFCRLLMAKSNLCLENYGQAEEELACINCFELGRANQATYYLMHYIQAKMRGQEEAAENSKNLYFQIASARGKRKIPCLETRSELLARDDCGALLHSMRQLDGIQTEKKVFGIRFFLAVNIFLLFLLFSVQNFLPARVEYRFPFLALACVVLFCSLFGLLIARLVRMNQVRRRLEYATGGYTVVWSILLTLFSLALCFYGFLGLVFSPSEKRLSGGKILVEHVNFLDPPNYDVWESCGLIFRRYLYVSDEEGNKITSGRESLYEEQEQTADSGFIAGDAASSDTEDATSSDVKNTAFPDGQRGEACCETVYQAVFAAEYDTVSYEYSAKGEPYCLAGAPFEKEVQGELVSARIKLVYNGLSKNGLCDVVVCYEEHYDSAGNRLDSTTILNFYAVTADGEVIAADKTSWAERGTDAYAEATGE